jgi:hypothetical protein
MHFLAEPESATRTTADSSDGPTFRRFEQRQKYFLWMIEDILRVVLSRRAMVDGKINKKIDLSVTGADINSRDNSSLSQSAYYMVEVLANLRDRSLISNDEFLRVIYRFFGESVDADAMLKAAKKDQAKSQGVDQKSDKKEDGNPTKKVITPPDTGMDTLPD